MNIDEYFGFENVVILNRFGALPLTKDYLNQLLLMPDKFTTPLYSGPNKLLKLCGHISNHSGSSFTYGVGKKVFTYKNRIQIYGVGWMSDLVCRKFKNYLQTIL